MTNKDTQIFQFNQSERNESGETPYGRISKWKYLKMMINWQIELLQKKGVDFEVIIRRKNDE